MENHCATLNTHSVRCQIGVRHYSPFPHHRMAVKQTRSILAQPGFMSCHSRADRLSGVPHSLLVHRPWVCAHTHKYINSLVNQYADCLHSRSEKYTQTVCAVTIHFSHSNFSNSQIAKAITAPTHPHK